LLLFLVNSRLFLDWLFVFEHLFFNNLAPSNGHVDIHHMDLRINNLKLHHIWFFCNLHSFVLKHILYVTILRIVYDLVSSVTTYMLRIPHRSLYFNLLNNNLRNCKNMVFFSFDSISFNIMICLIIIGIAHSCFLYNYLRFLS